MQPDNTDSLLGKSQSEWSKQHKLERIKIILNHSTFVNEKYKFFYFSTPKVACTAIKSFLMNLDGPVDIPQEPLTGYESKLSMRIHDRRFNPTPSILKVSENMQREAMTSNEWFRFAFVRNPYARFYSAWMNKIKLLEPHPRNLYAQIAQNICRLYPCTSNPGFPTFEGFVNYFYTDARDMFWLDGHFFQQSELIFPHLFQYHLIGKLEDFDTGFNKVIAHLNNRGVTSSKKNLTKENYSFKHNWRDYYNENIAQKVYELFEPDFRNFGYDIDSWKPSNDTQSSNTDLSSIESYYENEIRERNKTIQSLYKIRDQKIKLALGKN